MFSTYVRIFTIIMYALFYTTYLVTRLLNEKLLHLQNIQAKIIMDELLQFRYFYHSGLLFLLNYHIHTTYL